MEKIFTATGLRELDRYTLAHEQMNRIDLVERAAHTFVNAFKRLYAPRHKVFVFAGPGNNGADALAVSRLLLEDGYVVETILFNTEGKLSPECVENKDALLSTDRSRLSEVIDHFDPPHITRDHVIIDGLFGTGLNRPLSGGFAALISFINGLDAPIVSIDIPSGLYSEDNFGNDSRSVICATYTLTFECPKVSFLMPENASFVGEWLVLAVGLSEEGKRRVESTFFCPSDVDIARTLEVRPRFAHKGTFGHAMLITGSRGKMGAACLAARAALKSGLGLVTTRVPACGEVMIQTLVPESMISIDPTSDHIATCLLDKPYTAIGIGPGLGVNPETVNMFSQLLDSYRSPMVIDADALNILASYPDLFAKIPSGSILTPHSRELERLTSKCSSGYEQMCSAQALAQKYKIYVHLKGAYSATCMPSGNVVFNTTGNAGMATAGSGDVLLGIITGLLGSGYNPASAVVLGSYLHGLSGDIYSGKESQESLTAGDLINCLGLAFRQLRS